MHTIIPFLDFSSLTSYMLAAQHVKLSEQLSRPPARPVQCLTLRSWGNTYHMKSEGDYTGHFAQTTVNQVNRGTQVQVTEDREVATFSLPKRRKLVSVITAEKRAIWKQTARSF